MMNTKSECDLFSTGPDWIVEHPETLAVFEEWGIDYCCGGKSLDYVCRQRGIDPAMVLAKLREAAARTPDVPNSAGTGMRDCPG